jgi:CDP-glycerol glycerophosphotransferase
MINRIKRFALKNQATARLVYLGYLLYEKAISLLFLVMRLFPVHKNKIVFCTAKGKRYGDNPMYISDALLKRGKNYEIVWLLRDSVEEDIPAGVTRRRYSFLSEIYELATAKVWVDSNMKSAGFLKRRGQLYIQTWHGSYGLKKMGSDLGDKLPAVDRRIYQYNSKRTDVMLSNSKRTTEIYRRTIWYGGKILEYGSPRNDIFFEQATGVREKVDRYFHTAGKRIVLYAPTFRNDYRTDDFKLDYERLLAALQEKFRGDWVVFVRLHPNNMAEAADFIQYTDRILNATDYSVMQELLVAADVLVTDYSSCMFDFATTKKPCFLYATDVARYKEERDNYFEMEELPFPLAENNEQMGEIIDAFDQVKYENGLEELFALVGLNETGHASEIAADYIEKWMAEHGEG